MDQDKATLTGTAGAALNVATGLLTLLVNKGIITRPEFDQLVNKAASDEETRAALRIIWPSHL